MQKAKGVPSSSPQPSASQKVDPAVLAGDESDDPDLDLDFDAEAVDGRDLSLSPQAPEGLAMLQPLHRTILHYGKQHPLSLGTQSPLATTPHSALSRVFVNTLGRLGRWKRVLNSRPPELPFRTYVAISAFDVEASETGDILTVKGGVEQYLKTVENQIAQVSLGIRHQDVSSLMSPTPSSELSDAKPPTNSHNDPLIPGYDGDAARTHTFPHNQEVFVVKKMLPHSTSRATSNASAATTDAASVTDHRLEVVSIDDFSDFSDERLDPPSPPGLKRAHRKLPTRREFEFVRHSAGTASSLGVQTRESLMSGDSSSAVSSLSRATSDELAGGIQQWQMNALVDSLSDEEENGDVEDALRRLEGQINQDRQQEKQSKVDRWIQSIQGRATAARLGFPSPHNSHDSSDEDYGEIREKAQQSSAGDLDSRDSVSVNSLPEKSSQSSIISMPAPSKAGGNSGPALPSANEFSDTGSNVAQEAIEEAVPLEILQSRVTSDPHASTIVPSTTSPRALHFPPANNAPPSKQWKLHQSFVLNYRSDTLIQHFSMIDQELFINIRFEELLSHHSCIATDVADILDWGEFLRERARLKAEGRAHHKTDSLAVVRSRFNLVAQFVLSEVVLTHPTQRAVIYAKFIRMAWVRSNTDLQSCMLNFDYDSTQKAHVFKNYTMLVAIIAGLRSEWATKAMRQCTHRVGMWEQRIYHDLTEWTTPEGDFKHIRRAVDSLAEAKPLATTTTTTTQDASNSSRSDVPSSTSRSRAASEGKPPTSPACVPFFGIYLSQLHHYSELPDLIDPTAPHEPVGIDPVTQTFLAPAHPEVFSTLSPLPPSVQLEPLINVHKQRLTAGVIKSLVAGQHLASRVKYPLDKKLYQKCLKLRGLDSDTLGRALRLYTDVR